MIYVAPRKAFNKSLPPSAARGSVTVRRGPRSVPLGRPGWPGAAWKPDFRCRETACETWRCPSNTVHMKDQAENEIHTVLVSSTISSAILWNWRLFRLSLTVDTTCTTTVYPWSKLLVLLGDNNQQLNLPVDTNGKRLLLL